MGLKTRQLDGVGCAERDGKFTCLGGLGYAFADKTPTDAEHDAKVHEFIAWTNGLRTYGDLVAVLVYLAPMAQGQVVGGGFFGTADAKIARRLLGYAEELQASVDAYGLDGDARETEPELYDSFMRDAHSVYARADLEQLLDYEDYRNAVTLAKDVALAEVAAVKDAVKTAVKAAAETAGQTLTAASLLATVLPALPWVALALGGMWLYNNLKSR